MTREEIIKEAVERGMQKAQRRRQAGWRPQPQPCSRCNGTGTLDHFSHVVFNGKNGGCFHCAGTGVEPARKPRRTREQIQADRKIQVQEAIEQGRQALARMGFKVEP